MAPRLSTGQGCTAFAATQEPAQREARPVKLIRCRDWILAFQNQLYVPEIALAHERRMQPWPCPPLPRLHLPDINRVADPDPHGLSRQLRASGRGWRSGLDSQCAPPYLGVAGDYREAPYRRFRAGSLCRWNCEQRKLSNTTTTHPNGLVLLRLICPVPTAI